MWQGRRAATAHHRVALLAWHLDAGDHVAVLANLGTSGRPQVGIDGLGLRE